MGLIYEDYLQYHKTYTEKYGKKTIIFLQAGSFFELYATYNEKQEYVGCDMSVVVDILNIQVTRKNKKIKEIDIHNPLMAGFPTHSVRKFIDRLLNEGYTIVMIEQVTEPPNPERKITEIISPATVIDAFNCHDSNYLVSIYIEKYKREKDIYSVGFSAIDIATGKNFVHSIVTNKMEPDYWKEETFRLMQHYNPKECIVHYSKDIQFSNEELGQLWDIDASLIQNNCHGFPEIYNLSYQNEFLKKIFKDTDMLTPIEYLDFERENELLLSYLFMVQYVYEHKIKNILELSKPVRVQDSSYLVLTNNCIRQLNISDNYSFYSGKNDSLLSLINHCKTAIGRRMCNDRILYPCLNPDTINERYDLIDIFQRTPSQKNDEYDCKTIRKGLVGIYDIERLHRKLTLGIISPIEFFNIDTSYNKINALQDFFKDKHYLNFYDNHRRTFSMIPEIIDFYRNIFNVDVLERFPNPTMMDVSIFKRGISLEIDEHSDRIITNKKILGAIAVTLSKMIDKKITNVRVEYSDMYEWHLVLTKNRGNTLVNKKIKNILDTTAKKTFQVKDEDSKPLFPLNYEDIKVKDIRSNNCMILIRDENDILRKCSNEIMSSTRKIIALNLQKYKETIETIKEDYSEHFQDIVNLLGEVDLYSNLAKICLENNYYRPKILQEDNSFLDAKELRHPIVEKINTEEKYIPNDIKLNESGILLFGTNACGKSTLMKSIGLAIVMAQAGIYVPAKEFHYSPYTQLFTRILNNDNIFRGHSTFVVEMNELRGILKRCDKNSLVLGDELCSGTETISALSIISAGLDRMSKNKCSYIFTSHLHQLTTIPFIKEIQNLNIFHLKIHYDEVSKMLIYDRKLCEGSGPAIYGLEVCKSMDMDGEFITNAKKIERFLTGANEKLLNTKRSRYNSEVFIDECKICNSPAEHTHHINEQQFADSNGNFDTFHKNIKHNLIPLCQKCHYEVHNGDLDIFGYLKSTKGKTIHSTRV
tara:strand:- start:443 stop:3397 length:2955 start_codon:yes stop_codon:yes gene_type:complete